MRNEKAKNIKKHVSMLYIPTVNVSKFFSFSSNSFKAWLFLNEKGRLVHEMLPLTCTELCQKQNNLTGVRTSLDSFLSRKE